MIKEEIVETVSSYKYLGVTVDDCLKWNDHLKLLKNKVHQRMYFLSKLVCFNIDRTLCTLFYRSCIESIVTFCISVWGGNISVADKQGVNRIIKRRPESPMASEALTHYLIDVVSREFWKLARAILTHCPDMCTYLKEAAVCYHFALRASDIAGHSCPLQSGRTTRPLIGEMYIHVSTYLSGFYIIYHDSLSFMYRSHNR